MSRDDEHAPVPVPGLDWADESPTNSENCAVRLVALGDRKIGVIKVVREYFGLGLADAKDLVERAPVVLGERPRQTALAIIKALAATGAVAAIDGDETTIAGGFANVVMQDAGPRKIAVIKFVRELTGLGLRESKELCETPAAVVLQGVSRERAKEVAAEIAELGGTAVVAGVDRAAGDPVEEHVTLVLTHTGPKKIEIIKIIRETSGLGLARCKDISESVPATISTRVTRPEAERVAQAIRNAGGDARIEG